MHKQGDSHITSRMSSAEENASGAQREVSKEEYERLCTVYVSRLNYDTTDDDLWAAFSEFGLIRTVRVPKRPNGMPKGFAFVVFDNADCAAKAQKEMDGRTIDGWEIKTNISHFSRAEHDKQKKSMDRYDRDDRERRVRDERDRYDRDDRERRVCNDRYNYDMDYRERYDPYVRDRYTRDDRERYDRDDRERHDRMHRYDRIPPPPYMYYDPYPSYPPCRDFDRY